MSACETVEPCHNNPCDGIDEVARLLPKGRLWSLSRDSQAARYFKALGAVKSEINRAICQEWDELNPCKTIRLFDYWAKIYCFPNCVEPERFCDWVELMEDRSCPVGSIGFYRKVIDFVLPDKSVTVDFRQRGLLASQCANDSPRAADNVICITAPADCYSYEASSDTFQDGVNGRCYFIPEIECLRFYVLPLVSLGYKTTEINPNGSDIYAPEATAALKVNYYYDGGDCKGTCSEPPAPPVANDVTVIGCSNFEPAASPVPNTITTIACGAEANLAPVPNPTLTITCTGDT